MKAAQIDESSWFEVALHRGKWHTAYNDGLNNYQQSQWQQRVTMPGDVKYDVCGRYFRRECDRKEQWGVQSVEDGSEAEEALQCTGVADSIRKLTARMTILTLVPTWQKQHPYQPDNERGTCDHSCADGSFSLLPHMEGHVTKSGSVMTG